MADTKIDVVFQTGYGYKIKFLVQTWDTVLGEWKAEDLSSFTTILFRIEKPSKVQVDKEGTFSTDGTDGYIEVTLTELDGVFDEVGHYRAQAFLSNVNQYFPTSKIGFKVDDPL